VSLGCTHVSEGCRNCSAEGIHGYSPRLQKYATIVNGRPKWTGVVDVSPERLIQPSQWKKPFWVFVASNSDLFHDDIPDDFIDVVMTAIDKEQRHRFGILTKRSERMADYFEHRFVPPNAMIGVTVESQDNINRLDDLMTVEDATVRWVSCEPLLASVKLAGYLGADRLNWVTAGPETGDRARPCDVEWMRSVRDECWRTRIPFFTRHVIDGVAHRQMPPSLDNCSDGPSER
jgi:protein gp37